MHPSLLKILFRPSWFAFLAVVLGVPTSLRAQTSPVGSGDNSATSGPLFEELARMDSLAFDASFVSCNAEVANAIFADDVEFYHDVSGAQFGEEVRENTRRLTESCPGRQGITRVLVDGSLEVYPIRDYGAVQTGTHRFVERGAPTSTVAKFVHLWQRQDDGQWTLTRVLSFDHRTEQVGASGG